MELNKHSEQNTLSVLDGLEDERYWVERLSGAGGKVGFPYDRKKTGEFYTPASIPFAADEQLAQKLLKLSGGSDYLLHMILTAGLTLLLEKYTGAKDVIVGTPVYRQPEGVKPANSANSVIALRTAIDDKASFKALLGHTRKHMMEALEHPNFPAAALMEKLNRTFAETECDLFDVTLLLANVQSAEAIGRLPVQTAFHLERKEQRIQGEVRYNADLYDAQTIEGIVRHYLKLLDEAVSRAEAPVYELELLSREETDQLVYGFNRTEATYPDQLTIQQLFEEQAAAGSGRTAVILGEMSWTYGELNRRANQLAYLLIGKGVTKGTIVGLLLDRSFDMIVGILGIWKAGGAYLPIHPEYPQQRISFLLNNSQAAVVVTDSRYTPSLSPAERVNMDEANLEQWPTDNPPVSNGPQDLAYVLYTSGTTGNPKGVMIRHHSVINRLHWMQKQYSLTEEDVILQKTVFTFDVSVWELLWWALFGGKVCLLPPGGEKDPAAIIEAIDKHAVSLIHFVPSMLTIFLQYVDTSGSSARLGTLRKVFCSGEALTSRQVKQWYAQLPFSQAALVNLYGPTEATVDVTSYECDPAALPDAVPIGKPIDNTRLFIVNERLQPQPVGVLGELCIAGVGLAQGYLNQPGLTGEKFIALPFLPEQLAYRTGDLARWLPDGNVEYAGRVDDQVKIRGFRIELGEIEHHLASHPQIRETIAAVREDANGSPLLCAYFVSGDELNAKQLTAYLAERLPSYMIPSHFSRIDRIPLSANGKADRGKLPDPSAHSIPTGVEYTATQNEMQERLLAIWSEILGKEADRIGVHDNFFSLGGDSYIILQVNMKLNEWLGKEISAVTLYQHPTIALLAKHLSEISSPSASSEPYPSAAEEEEEDSIFGETLLFMEEIDNE